MASNIILVEIRMSTVVGSGQLGLDYIDNTFLQYTYLDSQYLSMTKLLTNLELIP